ncbi:MAG: hypothetical protein NXI32_26910, partial [bacterium]|nr:hypothetical protein [bacterium]
LDAQAVPGDYTASIVNQALLSLIDANNNEIPVTENSFRSATISLVPEPNSLLVALSFMLTCLLRRKRPQLCPCLVSANRNA